MSRVIMALMGAMIATALAGTAGADSGKWCFQWDIEYVDFDLIRGHNTVWLDDNSVDAPARYTYVAIKKYPDLNYSYYWLDSAGCTPTITISPSTIYYFKQYTLAERSNREVRVMPDGEDWESDVVDVYSWSDLSPSTILSLNYLDPPPDDDERRLMPAITTLLYQASLLSWDDDTIHWVSTDDDLDCGAWASESADHEYHVCLGNNWGDHRFSVAHEFGHTITWMDEGPRHGDYSGSEYYFAPSTHRCDCYYIEGYSHCPTSREFIGSGQKEGYSHFVGAAAYDSSYNTVPLNSAGVFFFYKYVMEATMTHYNLFPDILECPAVPPATCTGGISGDSNTTSEEPFPTTLDTSSDVKWMENECTPGSRTHYGTEWDWLDFFWNLWTYGSYKFTTTQIGLVWNGVSSGDIAYECCNTGYTSCVHMDSSDPLSCGTGAYTAYPYPFMVGKLWEADGNYDVAEGVLDNAYDVYGDDMGDSFALRGIAAGVNH